MGPFPFDVKLPLTKWLKEAFDSVRSHRDLKPLENKHISFQA